MEPARNRQPVRRPVPEPTREPRRIEEALAEIARDVRDAPRAWLDRTHVPGGGE